MTYNISRPSVRAPGIFKLFCAHHLHVAFWTNPRSSHAVIAEENVWIPHCSFNGITQRAGVLVRGQVRCERHGAHTGREENEFRYECICFGL